MVDDEEEDVQSDISIEDNGDIEDQAHQAYDELLFCADCVASNQIVEAEVYFASAFKRLEAIHEYIQQVKKEKAS